MGERRRKGRFLRFLATALLNTSSPTAVGEGLVFISKPSSLQPDISV